MANFSVFLQGLRSAAKVELKTCHLPCAEASKSRTVQVHAACRQSIGSRASAILRHTWPKYGSFALLCRRNLPPSAVTKDAGNRGEKIFGHSSQGRRMAEAGIRSALNVPVPSASFHGGRMGGRDSFIFWVCAKGDPGAPELPHAHGGEEQIPCQPDMIDDFTDDLAV